MDPIEAIDQRAKAAEEPANTPVPAEGGAEQETAQPLESDALRRLRAAQDLSARQIMRVTRDTSRDTQSAIRGLGDRIVAALNARPVPAAAPAAAPAPQPEPQRPEPQPEPARQPEPPRPQVQPPAARRQQEDTMKTVMAAVGAVLATLFVVWLLPGVIPHGPIIPAYQRQSYAPPSTEANPADYPGGYAPGADLDRQRRVLANCEREVERRHAAGLRARITWDSPFQCRVSSPIRQAGR